jgi:hypothetical protein
VRRTRERHGRSDDSGDDDDDDDDDATQSPHRLRVQWSPKFGQLVLPFPTL